MRLSVRPSAQFLMGLCGAVVLFVALTAWPATPTRDGSRGVKERVAAVAHGQSISDYEWSWSRSDTKIELGDSVYLDIRVHDVTGSFDHGGVSVSFPSLTSRTGADNEHISSQGDVTVGSTSGGVAEVNFYERGSQIYSSSDQPIIAEHLLVESYNPSWSSSSDRTVRLWITPKETGRFDILMRTWLCRDGWDDCDRRPASPDTEDQQDWGVRQLTIDVSDVAAGKPDLAFEGPPTVDGDPLSKRVHGRRHRHHPRQRKEHWQWLRGELGTRLPYRQVVAGPPV